MEEKNYDLDVIVKKSFFDKFVEKLKNLKVCPDFKESLDLIYKQLYKKYSDKESLVTLSRGANKGLRLFRTSLRSLKSNYHCQLDMRECEDEHSLDDDRKTRDFTVNSIYMWPIQNYTKLKLDYPRNGQFDIANKIVRAVNSMEETF